MKFKDLEIGQKFSFSMNSEVDWIKVTPRKYIDLDAKREYTASVNQVVELRDHCHVKAVFKPRAFGGLKRT